MVDANINRTKEGLRVVEDYSRFILNNDSLTQKIREIRHSVFEMSRKLSLEVIASRDVKNDCLSGNAEKPRMSGRDVIEANFNRVKEALRVLEESMKIFDPEMSHGFKLKRFSLYEIEQEYFGNIEV
jgi:thiamine-phosphate pyrophosphorylase